MNKRLLSTLITIVLLAWGVPGQKLKAPKLEPTASTETQQQMIKEGVALHDEGDYDGAIARYEQVLKENPNDAQAHTKAGRAKLYFGRVPEALIHFEAAIKADPNYDRAYYEQGFIYLRQNKLPESQEAFENVGFLRDRLYASYANCTTVLPQDRLLPASHRSTKSPRRLETDYTRHLRLCVR